MFLVLHTVLSQFRYQTMSFAHIFSNTPIAFRNLYCWSRWMTYQWNYVIVDDMSDRFSITRLCF